MVRTDDTGATGDTKYPVYLFGSNYVWIRSDVVFTLPQAMKRPPAFERYSQIGVFIRHLCEANRVLFVPCVKTCRLVATQRNTPVLTSVSRNGLSLQFAFAMPNGGLYSAHIFYLEAGNVCSTDFRYRRVYLSNACQCENRLATWRVCVSVAALDGSEIGGLFGNRIAEFVLHVLRAFETTISDQGAHYFIDQFTSMALINYTNDSIMVGGANERSIMGPPDLQPSIVCDLHRWLRMYTEPALWTPTGHKRITDLLAHTPQLLIVHRPLLCSVATADNGPDIFCKYMTFQDAVTKHLLLSLDTLRRGYSDERKAVAYESGDTFWTISLPRDDRHAGSPPWLKAVDGSNTGGVATVEIGTLIEERGLDAMFRATFSAPSRLYVHVNVLSNLGFNVTATSGVAAARVFTHTQITDVDNRCTVICSSPLTVIDSVTGRCVETDESPTPLSVLRHSSAKSVSETYVEKAHGEMSATGPFRRSVVSLNDFWPSVYAVRTSFSDTVLENIHFVFFTTVGDENAATTLTADALTRLALYNTKSSFQILPAPVMYALQQMFVHANRPRPER